MLNMKYLLAIAICLTSVESLAVETPKVAVSNVRRVFHNGEHNAFTDLIRFRERFQFEADGRILAVGRRGSGNAQLLASSPPYTAWERSELDQYVGGPLLIRWGERWVVGGRKNTVNGPRTAMHWLVEGKLHQFAELPSGGDNSYPGLVVMSPTHAVMSWYSSHEKDAAGKPITAIYMADLQLAEERKLSNER